MCYYSYKLYRTNRKFISPYYRQRLLNSFDCGRCPECLEKKRREWYVRTVYEVKDTFANNGYVYFDTLTYSEANIPRISHYFNIDPSVDGYCFDYKQVTDFIRLLRTTLNRDGYDVDNNLRYFYATEFGSRCTKRSHIHCMFFIRNNFIDPYEFSRYVSDCWSYGRTDGLPYKSHYYVSQHNVIRGNSSSVVKVSKYVSKYVVKNIEFNNMIDKKVEAVMRSVYSSLFRDIPCDVYFKFGGSKEVDSCSYCVDDSCYFSFCSSVTGTEIRRRIKRRLVMFHNQSLGYGLSAIDKPSEFYLDNPYLLVGDDEKTVLKIALPMYYKRKLFYKLSDYNGYKFWDLTLLGKRYRISSNMRLFDRLRRDFDCYKLRFKHDFDSVALSRYMVYSRGVMNLDFGSDVSVSDILSSPDVMFNYSSSCDYKRFHERLLCPDFVGSCGVYSVNSLDGSVLFDKFVFDNAYINNDYERLIDSLHSRRFTEKKQNTDSFVLKQQLTDLYKSVF